MGVQRRGFCLAAVTALALVGTTACSGSSSGSGGTSDARDLVIGATAQPQSMDPTTTAGSAIPQALLYNLYETLVKVDEEGDIKPLLASSYQVSTDRLTYTFTLQDKAKFSSGNPVDATAVVANINRVRNMAKGQYYSEMSDVASATATDTHTVTVKLKKPSQQWLYNMTTAAGMIADPKSFSTLASKPVGSGPFAFDSWKQGDSVNLKRNQEYWGTPPRFDAVTFRYFSDANAMTSAMKSGDIDVISDLTTPDAIDQFSDTSQYTVTQGTSNGIVTLGMNQGAGGNAALRNLKVRQAINYAINRKELLASVWGGKGTLVGSMVPPTDPWYVNLSNTYPYDPAKAKQLLAASGVKNISLRFRVPTLPYGPSSAQFIASELKQVGINVTVEEIDFPRWLKEVYGAGNYDLTVVNHTEPRSMLNFANPKYYWHYDSAQFQKLVAQADAADDTQYVALMKQAAKLLATDAAADFLWCFPHIVVTKADITGVSKNATSTSFDVTTMASRNS